MTLSTVPKAKPPTCSPHHLYQLSLQASLQLQQVPTPANRLLKQDLQDLAHRLTPGLTLTRHEREVLRRSLLSTLALAEAGQFTAATPSQLDTALADLAQSIQA
ncbi:hypothetical protein [Deinococcus aquatilis]|uniref:hypothetical protein n=1 Tax=Deinococcus aquatilis TaxID=519440 RepID=UPI00036F98D1|nr:hypothetical protein [Deinococcus aquatilis]